MRHLEYVPAMVSEPEREIDGRPRERQVSTDKRHCRIDHIPRRGDASGVVDRVIVENVQDMLLKLRSFPDMSSTLTKTLHPVAIVNDL